MIGYVDASVLLRVVFRQPDPLAEWASLEQAISSVVLRVECLRALDRLKLTARIDDRSFASVRSELLQALDGISLVALGESILERAAEPFPTSLGTLDGIHLATALTARAQVPDLVLATHDRELAIGSTAMGLPTIGVVL